MKEIVIILSMLFTAFAVSGQEVKKDSLVSISKSEFYKGKPFSKKRFIDVKNQQWKNDTFFISNCSQGFIDDTTDGVFEQYDYVGDLDKASQYKVVKRTEFNGETYYIVNTKLACKSVQLLGEPQIFEHLIVNYNESQTTDRRPIIEIWKIQNGDIQKIDSINFRHFEDYMEVKEFRLSNNYKIMFENDNGKCWQLNDSY